MLNKCHLTQSIEDDLGNAFYRVNNSSQGNPRYVIHYTAFLNDAEWQHQRGDVMGAYNQAREYARHLGYKVYRGRDFGGGFVTESYSIESDAEIILAVRKDRSISLQSKGV